MMQIPTPSNTAINPLIASLATTFQLQFTIENKTSNIPENIQNIKPQNNLKPKNGKRLVLDLDETVVHTFAPKDNFMDFVNDLTEDQRKRLYVLEFPGGETLFGYIRPGVENLLKVAFEEFESVGVWSAGTEFYVHEIVKLIFRGEKPLFVMTRNDCNELKINKKEMPCRYKPLENIYKKHPTHNESNTLIIDDRKDICKLNCLNNIQIPEFNLTSSNCTTLLNDNSLDILAKWFQTDDFRNTNDVRTLKSKSPFKI